MVLSGILRHGQRAGRGRTLSAREHSARLGVRGAAHRVGQNHAPRRDKRHAEVGDVQRAARHAASRERDGSHILRKHQQ
jgi:hypothetical protein